MKTFAIVVIGFNRMYNLKRLLDSLEKVDYNERSDITLILSIDKSDTLDIEKFAHDYSWLHGEKIVRTFDRNQGLKKHVLLCGEYTKEFDIVVILEDDIIVSPNMYNYSYEAVKFYENDTNIAGISLYGFQKNWLDWRLRFEPLTSDSDVYFLKVAQSWGQVWTYKMWTPFIEWLNDNKEFKFENNIPKVLFDWGENSWLKYHTLYCIRNNKYFVYPIVALSTNFSEPGTHNHSKVNDYQVEMGFKTTYNFIEFSKSIAIYDEYMNNMKINKALEIESEELTVDFWQTKDIYSRFLLTTKVLPYEIVKSYYLGLRPIELSILFNIQGEGIYLYDTSKVCCQNNKKSKFNKNSKNSLLTYSLRNSNQLSVLKYVLKSSINEVFNKIIIKIKRGS